MTRNASFETLTRHSRPDRESPQRRYHHGSAFFCLAGGPMPFGPVRAFGAIPPASSCPARPGISLRAPPVHKDTGVYAARRAQGHPALVILSALPVILSEAKNLRGAKHLYVNQLYKRGHIKNRTLFPVIRYVPITYFHGHPSFPTLSVMPDLDRASV